MTKHFYVHIDAILDSRAGVIQRLNPETHANLVKLGYHKRRGDFFEGVDPVEYRKLYEAREVETLMESTMTNIFQFLAPQIADTMKEMIAQEVPEHLKPTIEVNVWPYELTDEEKSHIRMSVYTRIEGMVGVNVVDKPISELHPAKCAEEYYMMIMYDYHDYLNAHANALIKNPRPFLMLVAPMVYFNTDPLKDPEAMEQLKNGINSLAVLEAALAPRLALKFINVDVFSIVYPDDRISKLDDEVAHAPRDIGQLDKLLVKQKESLR